MKVRELLALIPNGWLDELAEQTAVNHQVKKLDGELMFKLCLMSMLNLGKNGLRVMKRILHSAMFGALHQGPVPQSRFISISDGFSTMSPEYFEKLFGRLFELFNGQLGEHKALARYVTLGAKVFAEGMEQDSKCGIKHSVCMPGKGWQVHRRVPRVQRRARGLRKWIWVWRISSRACLPTKRKVARGSTGCSGNYSKSDGCFNS